VESIFNILAILIIATQKFIPVVDIALADAIAPHLMIFIKIILNVRKGRIDLKLKVDQKLMIFFRHMKMK